MTSRCNFKSTPLIIFVVVLPPERWPTKVKEVTCHHEVKLTFPDTVFLVIGTS